MDPNPEVEPIPTDDFNQDTDPVVLAYRIGEGLSPGQTVRVKRSEISKDPKLFELSSSSKSLGYDPRKSLSTRSKPKRPADPHVKRKIEYELMLKENRKAINKGLTLESLPADLKIESIEDQSAQQILAIVTNQLIEEGLWLDEFKDLTMSEAFPLSQAKVDTKIKVASAAMEQGSFLGNDDLTHDDQSANFSLPELSSQLRHARRPAFSSPPINNLMRASPKDLYHQIARRMIDTNYFEDHPQHAQLYPACYFVSRAVEDEEHFNVLLQAGLEHDFPHYTYHTYRLERIKVRRIIRVLIENFFAENPAIKSRLLMRVEPDKKDPKHFWERFHHVWDSLTTKQKQALEFLHFGDRREKKISKKEVASLLGISIDSLKSRLQTAIRRFKREFWELEGMSPKRIPRRLLKPTVTHNGLWYYQSAAWPATVYRVDPKNNLKVEIANKTLPKDKDLDWKTIARIKAEIIENCPVPHILETEYFDGMKPTIISFGRTPRR